MEFKTFKLKDLTVDGKGKYGIAASAVPYSKDLYTYLRITDINDDGTLNFEDLKSVDDDNVEKYILKPNDIVFARTGASTGRNYFYDIKDGVFVYAGFLIKFSLDSNKVNPRYIKYYCLSEKYKNWIKSFMTGSTRGNINAQTLGDMPIILPPRIQQDNMAKILSALDDKIELNNQINKNLEQQAQAIFYKMINVSSNFCHLSEIAELNPKRVLSKKTVARYIDMSNLSTSNSFPKSWEFKFYNGGMRFCNGDTILARITPCLENGKSAYINFLENREVAFGSTEYIVIASKGFYPSEFFYCLTKYDKFIDYAIKNMNGTSGRQRVSAEIIAKYLVPQLKKSDLREFNFLVPSMFSIIRNNAIENIHLKSIKELILPKLMSGEIDVSEINL